jgi:integrase
MPLRVIFRRAVEDCDIATNPVAGVRLPAVRSRKDRIAAPDESARLIAALPHPRDRAIWATAFYAGLRLGELQALLWGDVDLAAGVIRVERAIDAKGSVIEPKSRAGRRSVPVAGTLRDTLLAWKMQAGHSGYAFGTSATQPFSYSTIRGRARAAWAGAGLAGLTLHECRHTCASMMIAAGVNAKALTTYMGHGSIETTFNLYGHLMPDNEGEAAALMDAYLARADTASRVSQLEGPDG